MTFAKLIESVRGEDRVPEGVKLPRVGIRVLSAEGYVGRHDELAHLEADRGLEFDDDVIVLETTNGDHA
jgi:hypothetical protein